MYPDMLTIGIARNRRAVNALLAASLAMLLALSSNPSRGDESTPVEKPTPGKPTARPDRKNVKLPGMVINFQKRCVDLEGSICLDRGFLELVACTKRSKEHESIVAINAKPMHIHTALLLLGAINGNPAMRKPLDKEKTRWIEVPPRGDSVDVYLVFEASDGNMVERPISNFIARSGKQPDEPGVDKDEEEDKDIEFPHTFLFAGSLLRDNGPGSAPIPERSEWKRDYHRDLRRRTALPSRHSKPGQWSTDVADRFNGPAQSRNRGHTPSPPEAPTSSETSQRGRVSPGWRLTTGEITPDMSRTIEPVKGRFP